MEPVVLAPHSAFLDHGFLQHDGAQYIGHVNLHYQVCLSPGDLDPPHSILFAYQRSLMISNEHKERDECAQNEHINISLQLSKNWLHYSF